MCCLRLLSLAILVAPRICAASAAVSPTLSCDSGRDIEQHPYAVLDASIRIVTSARAWIEIDEDGRALTLGNFEVMAKLVSPPRLAKFGGWVAAGSTNISVRDTAVPSLPVSFRVRVYCEQAPRRAEQLQRVAAAAPPDHVDANALPAILKALAAINNTQIDPDLRIYAVHLAAQAQMLGGRSTESAATFVAAEQDWRNYGDAARALAARAAWAEEQYGLGNYDVAADAGSTLPRADGGALGYYAARLTNNRCLALIYRDRRNEAVDCFSTLVQRLVQLAEPLDLANALINRGNTERELGALEAASASMLAAQRMMDSPELARMPAKDVAMIRGRTRLLRADLALRSAALAQALGDYDAALSDFATADAPRWRATVLLQLAALFGRIGAYGDAYATWTQAIRLIDARSAPNRFASALLILARIERENGHAIFSAWLARQAELDYETLAAPSGRQAAEILRIHALVDAGKLATAHSYAKGLAKDLPSYRESWNLALASIALATHDGAAALEALDESDAAATLDEKIEHGVAMAKAKRELGKTPSALDQLSETLALVDGAAMLSANPLLRMLLQKRSEPIRRLGIDWLLEDGGGSDATALWNWLRQAHVTSGEALLATRGASASNSDAFDVALARELLLSQSDAIIAPHGLAGAMSFRVTAPVLHDPASTIALARVQASLDDDSAMLALIDGGERGALLWITAQNITVTATAPPTVIRSAAKNLAYDLRSPDADVARIAVEARELAAALWPGDARAAQRVRRLYVLEDALADAIPWPVLPDERGEPLVNNTDISLVHISASIAKTELSPPRSLRVLVAPQRSAGGGKLPTLVGAFDEPALVATAIAPWPTETFDTSKATLKGDLLTALSEPGTWLHVAAHGMTQPGYVGRSGLWLDPAQGDGLPQFVSVFDLFEAGANADLVVLNACDLGSAATESPETLAFADVLVRLGARNVIAAQWPVSDGAAAIWVPAFYAALTSATPEPAHALRLAQRQLLSTRAFRHPYYWASLAHLSNFPLVAATSDGARP